MTDVVDAQNAALAAELAAAEAEYVYLNDVMESNFLGFFIVAGVYLLTAIIFFLLRTPLLTTPIQDKIVAELMADDNPDSLTPQQTADGTPQN